MKEVPLPMRLVATIIQHMIGKTGKKTLIMDRTNWKFGNQNINILMLGIKHNNITYPLMFKLLNKRGNSNTQERKQLIDDYIEWFGVDTIECLLADREFIGKEWIAYLQDKSINYIIRVRNNFQINRTGNEDDNFCISDLLRSVKVGETYQSNNLIFMKGNKNYVIGLRKNTTKGKADNVILITNIKSNKILTEYKQRWQIECLFKAMKSSGFNIEDTHVKHLDRLERLISIVMIAFVWCYNVGDYVNENIEKIRIKKHKNRAISVFKLGLSILNRWLSTNRKPRNLKPLELFSKVLYCT